MGSLLELLRLPIVIINVCLSSCFCVSYVFVMYLLYELSGFKCYLLNIIKSKICFISNFIQAKDRQTSDRDNIDDLLLLL